MRTADISTGQRARFALATAIILGLLAACGGRGDSGTDVASDGVVLDAQGRPITVVPQSPTTPTTPVAGNRRPAADSNAALTEQEPGPVEPVDPVEVTAVPVVSGLDNPWAIAFLPDGRIVVTERSGQLRFVTLDGRLSAPIAGVPAVSSAGHGGLLDVVVSPDFDNDRRLYFTYVEAVGADAATTVVARAVLEDEAAKPVQDGEVIAPVAGDSVGANGSPAANDDPGSPADGAAALPKATLTQWEVLFRQAPAVRGFNHYGSRLAFDANGDLYVALGDRNELGMVQDLSRSEGKVLRIRPDGTIPEDNPARLAMAPEGSRAVDLGAADDRFAGTGTLPAIWTYGHRNPQGIAVHPQTGEIWLSEHGARGGDEINRLRRGRNFGWPRITYSADYGTGRPLGEGTTADWVVPPMHYWVPISSAPAGMTFYTGDKLPGWQGSLLVGMLAGKRLSRLTLDEDGITILSEGLHLQSLDARIRDVRQGLDGYPYLLSDNGTLYRVEPQPPAEPAPEEAGEPAGEPGSPGGVAVPVVDAVPAS